MRLNLSTHPKALRPLLATEMWERFAFYLIQGLLVFYLSDVYHFSDKQCYRVMGEFTALLYISPIVGGLLTDKALDIKLSILIGGLLLSLGYGLLASSNTITHFHLSLSMIVMGNGLFKPSISGLLGEQYHEMPSKRNEGFTFFYMGINMGALIAGLIASTLQKTFGWGWTFSVASVSLLTAVIFFKFTRQKIQTIRASASYSSVLKMLVILPLLIYAIAHFFRVEYGVGGLLIIIALSLIVYALKLICGHHGKQRQDLLMAFLLILLSIIYWMLDFQIFFTGNLYVNRLVEKKFLGLSLSTSMFIASASLYILILSPLFNLAWFRLSKRNITPSYLSKNILGFVFTGLSFSVLTISTFSINEHHLVSAAWVFLSYFLLMVADLFISPTGLAAMSSLAPIHLSGVIMGLWFVGTGYGTYFAGEIARWAAVPLDINAYSEMGYIYRWAFLKYTLFAFITAMMLSVIMLLYRRTTYDRINTTYRTRNAYS